MDLYDNFSGFRYYDFMAAFNYLTAGGDQAKVKKASQMLIYAVVGIVVAILAFSISTIVTGLVRG